jgi:hypothetical protein
MALQADTGVIEEKSEEKIGVAVIVFGWASWGAAVLRP